MTARKARVSRRLRERVARTADHHCGYCRTPERIAGFRMNIEHILPEAKGGKSVGGHRGKTEAADGVLDGRKAPGETLALGVIQEKTPEPLASGEETLDPVPAGCRSRARSAHFFRGNLGPEKPRLGCHRGMGKGGNMTEQERRDPYGVPTHGKRRVARGCILVLIIVLAFALLLLAVFDYFWNEYNPVYHGKRLYAWADQAIWDPSPEARAQATQVLLGALGRERGEPRVQLLIRFVRPQRGKEEKTELPKEVLPFLIEALGVDDLPPGSYPAYALRFGAGPDTAPALAEALRHHKNPAVRRQAAAILGDLGVRAETAIPVLTEALDDDDKAVRLAAAEALGKLGVRPKIKPGKG